MSTTQIGSQGGRGFLMEQRSGWKNKTRQRWDSGWVKRVSLYQYKLGLPYTNETQYGSFQSHKSNKRFHERTLVYDYKESYDQGCPWRTNPQLPGPSVGFQPNINSVSAYFRTYKLVTNKGNLKTLQGPFPTGVSLIVLRNGLFSRQDNQPLVVVMNVLQKEYSNLNTTLRDFQSSQCLDDPHTIVFNVRHQPSNQLQFFNWETIVDSNGYKSIRHHMSLEEVQDLGEAKMLLDLKNDQITSLLNSLKMVEIKANKNIAQANYKTSTEKNKYETVKRELERSKGELAKSKRETEKLEQRAKEITSKGEQANKEFQQKLKGERQKSKGLSSSMRENEIRFEQAKQELQVCRKELKGYKRIVNISRILQTTGQSSPDEIPPYLDLMNLLKDQSDRMAQLQKELNNMTEQTIGEITVRERKISSFEKEMKKLEVENSSLTNQLTTVAQVIQEKQQELYYQKEILDREKQTQQSTLEQLNSELITLRTSINYYERESLIGNDRQEDSLKFLHQITAGFEEKEKQFQKELGDLQEDYQQFRKQTQLKQQELKHQAQKWQQSSVEQSELVSALSEQVKSKEEMLRAIESQTSVFQKHMQQMALEIDRWKVQSEQTLRSKHELKAAIKKREEEFHQKQQILTEQLEESRRRASQLRVIEIQEQESRYYNLSSELAPDRNWHQMYLTESLEYNKYLTKLYSLLTP